MIVKFDMHLGTEFEGWLLWYSLPVLYGILPTAYYNHYAKLVSGIGSSQINPEQLQMADKLLNEFYKKIADLYGE